MSTKINKRHINIYNTYFFHKFIKKIFKSELTVVIILILGIYRVALDVCRKLYCIFRLLLNSIQMDQKTFLQLSFGIDSWISF